MIASSSPPKRKRIPILYLLAGPLIGGLCTHLFDLTILRRYSEVAPQSPRDRRIVHLNNDDVLSNGADMIPNSDADYDRYEKHQSPDDGECISMHAWEEMSFPVCNSIHEIDFFSKYRPNGLIKHITHGGFNELYQYMELFANETSGETSVQSLALKILKYEKEYTNHKFEVVRRDSLILERLTKSPHISAVYGYCGFVIISHFVTRGTLADKLEEWHLGAIRISSMKRLQYAVDIARGLRDLHNIDGDGRPSATHGDLKEHQYLFAENGRLQLSDFNKGQFLSMSSTSGEACTYRPSSTTYNDKVFRSPEEYQNMQQTATTDIFALGSLFYYLVTGSRIWYGVDQKRARKNIIQGLKPKIAERILKSKDPVDVALLKAYEMCTEYKPDKRASAVEVSEFLDQVWKNLS